MKPLRWPRSSSIYGRSRERIYNSRRSENHRGAWRNLLPHTIVAAKGVEIGIMLISSVIGRAKSTEEQDGSFSPTQ